jgi:hypothetical protein
LGGEVTTHRAIAWCVLLFSLATVGDATAQTARDAVRAFAKLDARTETGVSYRDYVAALGDLNFELQSFAESAESRKYPEVQKALDLAMLRHLEAKELWGLTFGRSGSKSLTATSEIARAFLARYPDAARPLKDGGAMLSGGNVSIEFLIPFIWQDASRNVAKAKQLLPAQ